MIQQLVHRGLSDFMTCFVQALATPEVLSPFVDSSNQVKTPHIHEKTVESRFLPCYHYHLSIIHGDKVEVVAPSPAKHHPAWCCDDLVADVAQEPVVPQA